MKKATFEAIHTALTNFGYDNAEVMDELYKEIHRGDEAKAKNAEGYARLHEIVMGALNATATAVTIAELWDAIAEEATAEGFTKGKVQHAVTRMWTDEIVKIEGKPNTYRKA